MYDQSIHKPKHGRLLVTSASVASCIRNVRLTLSVHNAALFGKRPSHNATVLWLLSPYYQVTSDKVTSHTQAFAKCARMQEVQVFHAGSKNCERRLALPHRQVFQRLIDEFIEWRWTSFQCRQFDVVHSLGVVRPSTAINVYASSCIDKAVATFPPSL